MADEPDEDLTLDVQDDPQPDNQEDDAEGFALALEGEDEPPADTGADSEVIRSMRAELKVTKQELAGLRKAATPPKVLGARPTFEDHDFNQDAYDEALLKWNADKAEIDSAQKRAQDEAENRSKTWREELQGYERKKAALPVRDYDVAEAAVEAALTDIQQAIIVKGAEDPAKVIYLLGKRPDQLKALAEIADPVKFTAAMVRLEGKISMSTRQAPPPPESRPRGSAPLSKANADKHMEKLEAEADKTGDRTKILEYRRELRAREAKRRA